MILLKIAVTLLFVTLWVKSKFLNQKLVVSDVFQLFFLIIYLPYFLFNPSARSEWVSLSFTSEEIFRADFIVISILFVGSIFSMLKIRYHINSDHIERLEFDSKGEFFLGGFAIVICIFFLLYLTLQEEYWSFHQSIVKYLTYQMPLDEYRYERNVRFSKIFLTNELLGYLRYTIMPILYLMICYPFIKRKKFILVFSIFCAYYFLFAISFAKLPIFCYLGYLMCVTLYFFKREINFKYFIFFAFVTLFASVLMLSLLYRIQWAGISPPGSSNYIPIPVLLSLERVWGESYSVILRYCAVYPDKLPFTGFSGIALIAKYLSLPIRLPDLEVVHILLGVDETASNPGLFALGGYASFGYFGVVSYVIMAYSVLWLLDYVAICIRTLYYYNIYQSIMIVNVLFLLQVSLQTTFLSYGIVVVPIFLLLLDKVFLFLKKLNLVNENYAPTRRPQAIHHRGGRHR